MKQVANSGRRASAQTRKKILEAAFEEFQLRGFQAASLDTILSRAGVTKGALYHHFRDKRALGYAVLDEEIRAPVLATYVAPLLAEDADPLAVLQRSIRAKAEGMSDQKARLGCPLNNFAQEMSPVDDGFRERIAKLLRDWADGYTEALGRAQRVGVVRPDVDTRQIAHFVVAAVEGSFGAAKNAGSAAVLRSNMDTLAEFLDTLRPRWGGAPRRRRSGATGARRGVRK
jgi:TetR/AcrR family transcriptional regulator, transcriptional repressor for nem operon